MDKPKIGVLCRVLAENRERFLIAIFALQLPAKHMNLKRACEVQGLLLCGGSVFLTIECRYRVHVRYIILGTPLGFSTF
jgi:hypothetical protein